MAIRGNKPLPPVLAEPMLTQIYVAMCIWRYWLYELISVI